MHFIIIPFDSSHLYGILSPFSVDGKQISKDALPQGRCVCVCMHAIFVHLEKASRFKQLLKQLQIFHRIPSKSMARGPCLGFPLPAL